MASSVRAGLIAALATLSLASCGGGGSPSSPPSSPPPPSPPGSNAPPTFTSGATVSVQENAVGVVYRPVATDPENAAISYGTIIGGPDAARFVMNPVTREIRFAVQPNFEAPADTGGNNVYDISFTASDGTNIVAQNVAITVTDVPNGFHVHRLATGLNAPIYVAGLPDGTGRVVVVERGGRIRVMNPSTGAIAATDFLNITSQIDTVSEKGLLSIAFSPNFLNDRTFYIHMNPNSANVTEIRQYRTMANALDVADTSTANPILTIPQPATGNHKGGTVLFDLAGRLLISLGDGGGTPETAQDLNSLRGKILRIDPTTDAFPTDDTRDYSIPAGNAFASGGGLPEIWAMGLRNPFRFSVDPVTGDIFIGDVGEGAVEEVDRVPVGATGLLNFGWNRREGSQPNNGGTDDPSFLLPVAEYFHGSSTIQGNSVTGGPIYRGPVEDLQGQYVFGDFIVGNIWSIPIGSLVVGSTLPASSFTQRTTAFTPDAGTLGPNSIVALSTDTNGNLYIVDIGGEVFRVEPGP